VVPAGSVKDHPDVASWQAPTVQNPHVPDSEIDAAKEDIPDRVFNQEYRAEFVDDTGSVFGNVRERNVENYTLPVGVKESTSPYRIGVDFARFDDWTIVLVLDEDGLVVAFERIQQTSWDRIKSLIERMTNRYTPNTVALDGTRDNKIVEDIERSGHRAEPVRFSSQKKEL
jgi:HSP20 family molecular chaperone IbpA